MTKTLRLLVSLLTTLLVLSACRGQTEPETPATSWVAPTTPATGALPAFPGAQGAGTQTSGGRGGQVIEVTNLNDTGAGSLRDAIEKAGPRIIVFRVGGLIELRKPLRIENPYVTIAGQTAPGGGITLRGTSDGDGEMIIIQNVQDVIMRYLRIRRGGDGEPGHGQINILIGSGAHDIIVDHVSTSWTLDENIAVFRNIPRDADPEQWPPIHNVTLQRSIMAEGLYPHSTGTQVGGEFEVDGWRGVYDITIHHNLFVNNSHRNPAVGSTGTQVINNVVYNWGTKLGETITATSADWIGNYFKPGPLSDAQRLLVHNAFPKGSPNTPYPTPSLYMAGNASPPLFADTSADNWAMYRIHYSEVPVPPEFRRATALPQPLVPVAIQTAHEAYASVLADSGANARLDCQGYWVANADAVDLRLVTEVTTGTGPSGPTHPTHEQEVGGYPALEPGLACADGDHDGMPDEWEVTNGRTKPQAYDADRYDLNTDYTNIEVYLNGVPAAP